MLISSVCCTFPRPLQDLFLECSRKQFRLQTAGQKEFIQVEDAPGESFGAKMNRGCGLASGDVIHKWDDDDFYHPLFLEFMADALGKRPLFEMAELGEFLSADLREWKRGWKCFRLCSGVGIGGTFVFHRKVLLKKQFPDRPKSIDTAFREEHPRLKTLRIDGHPELYCYIAHGANISGAGFLASFPETGAASACLQAHVERLFDAYSN